MLKTLRVILAIVFFCLITFLFVDFRNTGPEWYDWFKLTQLIPAIFAGAFVSVIILLILTILFGRIYCSVICPLGVFQDIISRIYSVFLKKRKRNQRFTYKRGHPILRYSVFALFFIAMFIGASYAGWRMWASLIEPYSAYGRIASSFFGPVYDTGNNILADISVSNDTTTFWHVPTQELVTPVFWIALATFIILIATVVLAGRLWCNTICPAGTLLGIVSRYSLFAPRIDNSKCVKCKKCERDCKSQCIDISNQKIDYSRCVTCFNCLGQCKFDAMKYSLRLKNNQSEKN